MFRNRWKLFIILSIIILVISVVASFFLGRGEDKEGTIPTVPIETQPTSRPVPTRIRITSKPTPTLVPGITRAFTGEKKPDLSNEEIETLQEAFELREQLPLKTDFFELDYDYAVNRFIVTIDEPFGRNRGRFDQWLIGNEYGAIPVEKFIFRGER